MASLSQQTGRLSISAAELKQLTGWPDAVIEDYINILRDYLRLAVAVDDGSDTTTDLMVEIGLGQSQILNKVTKLINSIISEQQFSKPKRERQDDDFAPIASSLSRLKIRNLKSEVSIIGTATISNIQTDSATINTNTPSGGTAYALELKDESGATLGYLPIYGSLW